MARTRTLHVYTLAGLWVVLSLITPCWASFNIDVKAGLQSLQNPITLEDTSRTRFEVELAGTTPASDHLEICLLYTSPSPRDRS